VAVNNINLTFVLRTARKRGPLSSDQFNDLFSEVGADLANISQSWNADFVPLTYAIPDGVLDSSVNAYTNGLDGANFYARYAATAQNDPTFFNSIKNRPYTVYEILEDIYSRVSVLSNNLQSQINNIVITATNVSVVDSANLFTATNVEGALSELASQIQLLGTGGGGGGGGGGVSLSNGTPTPIGTGSGFPGSSTLASRSDHAHQVLTATPVAIGSTLSAGSSSSLAAADHIHTLPFSIVQNVLSTATSALTFNSKNLSSVADPLVSTDVATKNYVDNNSAPTQLQISNTSIVTTSTTTDAIAGGMQLTTNAGSTHNYMIVFNTSVSLDLGGANLYFTVYVNGVAQTGTVRRYQPSNVGATEIMPMSITYVVTGIPTSTQVDVRWHVDNGAVTATMYERNLTLVRVN
jgi:hypothetical protein